MIPLLLRPGPRTGERAVDYSWVDAKLVSSVETESAPRDPSGGDCSSRVAAGQPRRVEKC